MIIIWTWTYTSALLFQNINELRSQTSAQTQTWPLWSECHFRAIFAAWFTLSLAGDNNYFEERSLTLLKHKNLKLTTLILCPVQKNNNLVLSISWRNRGEVRSCDTTKLHNVSYHTKQHMGEPHHEPFTYIMPVILRTKLFRGIIMGLTWLQRTARVSWVSSEINVKTPMAFSVTTFWANMSSLENLPLKSTWLPCSSKQT